MSIYIPIPISEVEEKEEEPSKTYRLDLDNKRIVGMIDGLEAVEQAIRKSLITPRFKCLIYSNQYASEHKEFLASGDVSQELIEVSIPGFIQSALSTDTRILATYDFEFEVINDGIYISFKVDTIYGSTAVEEVI